MPPLATIDALTDDLTRRRFRLAAAADGWSIGPHRSPRVHAARSLVEFDTLLAMGVVPVTVGSTGHLGSRPLGWTALAQEAHIAVMDTFGGADIAMLRTARVELVVASSQLARTAPAEMADYLRLGVPVVEIPHDDVPEQLRRVGAALSLPERAENLATTLELRIDTFNPAWRPRSICVFTDRGDGSVYVTTPHAPLAVLLRQLGLPSPTCPPHAHHLGRPDTVAIPRSRLRELDAELLLGLDLDGGALAAIEADPRFAVLPAVRNRRYRRLDPTGSYAVAVPSVLTVTTALDALTAALSR